MASKKELRALITLAGKIDPSLQTAMMKASKMNTNLVQQSQKSAGSMSKVWTIAKGVFAGNLLTKGVTMAVNGIKRVGTEGVDLASDLTEVQNVVDTTFGGSSGQINAWSQKALDAFGLSELQAKKFTGTMGAMLKSSGISSKYLVQMSEGLSGLAGDFASFYNLDHQDAFDKIRAGISGETEPLKQLGINMSVANLEAFALSQGITTSYSKMDQASQTLLRYNYLMSVSKDAQSDFAKTLDTSYANQKRLFTTNLNQKMAELAKQSLPMLTQGFKMLNNYIGTIDVGRVGTQISDKLGAAYSLIITYGPSVVSTFKDFGSAAYGAFETVKPGLAWIITDGIPAVTGIASSLLRFEPLIWGVVGAFVAYKGIMFGVAIAQGIAKAATVASTIAQEVHNGILLISAVRSGGLAAGTAALTAAEGSATVAQWALNAAMSANPIGLVIVGIGALIAVGVLLYKNWESITTAVQGAWNWFTNLIHGMPDVALALTGPLAPLLLLIKHFDKVKDSVGGAIAAVKNFFGFGGKNKNKDAEVDVSGPTLVSEGMPAFATGGFTNQPSIFGEDGPEAAIPIKYRNPRSISILNQTARAIGAEPGGGGKTPILLNFNFNGPVSNQEQVVNGVKMAKDYILQVLEEYFDGEGRTSFG